MNDNLEVAESFGDAGDIFTINSHLKKNPNGELNIEVYTYSDMNAEKDTTLTDSTQNMLLFTYTLDTYQVSKGKINKQSTKELQRHHKPDPTANAILPYPDSTMDRAKKGMVNTAKVHRQQIYHKADN